jgi:predicted N-acetyltransferase YhbS
MIHRTATGDDIDACLALEWTRSADDLRWHAAAKLLFVAIDDGAVVGYARLESFWKAMPYLAMIEVREDRRGRDVGSGLLRHVCDDLRARGYTALLSSTTSGEDGPRRWHLRNGFVDVGRLVALNRDGADELFYRLPL